MHRAHVVVISRELTGTIRLPCLTFNVFDTGNGATLIRDQRDLQVAGFPGDASDQTSFLSLFRQLLRVTSETTTIGVYQLFHQFRSTTTEIQ